MSRAGLGARLARNGANATATLIRFADRLQPDRSEPWVDSDARRSWELCQRRGGFSRHRRRCPMAERLLDDTRPLPWKARDERGSVIYLGTGVEVLRGGASGDDDAIARCGPNGLVIAKNAEW